MRILIADDNPVDRTLLQGLLTRAGHEVISAQDGLQSWSILQARNPPELAILDRHMPGLDGLEVCSRLRQRDDRPYVFVILLTSNHHTDHLLEGLAACADDYLTKPLDPALLRARLAVGQRILELQTKFIEAQEKLSFQADHDSLTGLFGRAAILLQLEREIGRAIRNQTSLGVVIADLDFFKSINDSHGHAAGDGALREVASRFKSSVRIYDIVGRLGGEEFLILLPGCDPADTLAQAERLRECIAATPLHLENRDLAVTASLGCASADLSGVERSMDLIARADAAMYRAKESGRNRVEVSGSANTLLTSAGHGRLGA